MLVVGMPLLKKFSLDDIAICLLGLFSRMVGLILYAFSSSTIMAFLGKFCLNFEVVFNDMGSWELFMCGLYHVQ